MAKDTKDITDGTFVKTDKVGVYYRYTQRGDKIFSIRGKLNGRTYREKVGSKSEGITKQYCVNYRNQKHGIKRLGDDSPLHEVTVYTLNEASELYFEKIKHKSNTSNMTSVYVKHIQDTRIGKLPLTEITRNDLELLKSSKLEEKSIKTKRTYSKATVNRIIDMVSAIFNYMHEYHDVKVDNPAKGLERYKVNNKRDRYLENSEITELIDAIHNDDKRRKKDLLELFVRLAVTTGARLTSILHITKSDINLKTGQIALKDFKRDDMTYTGYIHDSVRPMLEEQMKNIRMIGCIIGGNPKPMQKENINKMLQPLLNELFNDGLELDDAKRRVVIHSLRHTFASHLAINGVPIFTIQKLMNHAEISQTMRYAKLMPHQGSNDVLNLFKDTQN